jgi:signal peptidase I
MSLRAKKRPKQKGDKPKHPWRENIESLTVAIIVALVLKAFVIEVSKIPSGSMQPTLQGNPHAGVFDRVLVDKLSFHFRAPLRSEVVVFKHPLERSRNMVKRIAGVGPEWLRIENGDLWSRPDEASDWTIVRRTRAVENEMWRLLPPRSERLSDWKAAEGSPGWVVRPGEIEARGDGSVRFRPDDGVILDEYLDGYPESIREQMPREMPPHWRADAPVGDLRVDLSVEALPGCAEVAIEVGESSVTYRFVLPGPAAPAGASPAIEVRGVDAEVQRIVPEDSEGREWRLEEGEVVHVRAQNLDDLLELCLDGDWVLEAPVPAAVNGRSRLALHAAGEGAEITGLEVRRDVHYVVSETGVGELWIPADHYFMLGDNTRDSADGREWKAVTVSIPDGAGGTRLEQGNYRFSEFDPHPENPTNAVEHDGRMVRLFRDRFGERHTVDADAPGLFEPVPASLVPRELIQGRALAVFWPIKPLSGLWRLTWIH